MAKKQDLKYDDLVKVKPITDNQKVVFEETRGKYLLNSRIILFLCDY